MDCEKFDEFHSNVGVGKRFKFPKKFFDECNRIDNASVPRKLRSAIKKRSRHSISPVSKKLNHVFDGDVNKSKLNLSRGGSSRCVEELVGPITKDEEEVAETLYALAGMIPETSIPSASKINSQLSEVKSLASQEHVTSAIANGEAKKEQEIRTTSSQFNAVAVSAGEASKSKLLEDASRCDTSMNSEQLEISLQPVVGSGYQVNQQNTLKEKRNDGLMLWPGLSAVGSSCSDTLGSSPQFPIAKFPAWFGSTAQNTESCLPTVKDSEVPLDSRKSWKRCAAHVHISQLIKDLQTTVKKDRVSFHNELKQGTRITENGPTGKVNNRHGIVSTGSIACSTTEKNPTEVRNAILLHKRLLQDQQQASTTSGFNSLVKQQNIDFMSLSAGSYVMKGANGANIAGHNLEVPLNSQNHPALHFLMPQNGYSSTSFHCHPATTAAQQVLLPPYLGGASTRPSLEAAMALPRQPLHQNELQNVSAQYKFGVSSSQTRDWQNAGRHTPIFGPSQAQFATSSSSKEPLSSKYAPAMLNEQELTSISTSRATTSRNRGQYYNFPPGLEGLGNGHGLYPNNVPSMQLLCNDHR